MIQVLFPMELAGPDGWIGEGGDLDSSNVAKYRVRNGLLDIKLTPWAARSIVEFLWETTKSIHARISTRMGDMALLAGSRELFLNSNRATRMSFELLDRNTLTSVSREDLDILYEMKLCQDTRPLFEIMNVTRFILRKTGDEAILDGDMMAKSVITIMES